MRKYKNIGVGLGLTLLVLVVTVFSSAIAPNYAQAQTSSQAKDLANIWCSSPAAKSKAQSQKINLNVNQCKKGFAGGFLGKGLNEADVCPFTGLATEDPSCQLGWNEGRAERNPDKSKYPSQCQGWGTAIELAACETGVNGKKNFKNSSVCDQYHNTGGIKPNNACQGGFNNTNVTITQDMKDACQDFKSNNTYYNTCLAGYTGTLNCNTGTTAGSQSRKACQEGADAAAANSSSGDDAQAKCSSASAASLLSFGWIACPILSGIDDFVKVTNNVIEDQLNFKVSKYLNDDVHKSWTILKNIATTLLIIIMLVMVLSQAMGGGPFEAYTVRKVLPKTVIAVILMQISWDLAIWAINIANDVGQGVKDLMFAPFGGGSHMSLEYLIGKLGGAAPGLTVGAIFTGLILATTVGGLTIIGIGILALAVVLSILVGLFVLLLRQVLIILCVIVIPLALVLWILPGTQRYWKLWSDNFLRLLMLFPIIVAIIAAGRIFANITATASTSGDAILAVFGVMAGFFGPYWFLPKAFQWGGSAMSAIASTTGRLTKPAREAPRKFIREQAKHNREQRREARNQRLSYGQARRFDRAYAAMGGIGLNRVAREQRHARMLAEGREAGQKEIQQAIVGSEYENLDHGQKLKALDLLAQGKYDPITGLNGKDPAVQRWGLEQLAQFGDWDRIDVWRSQHDIDERVWQDFVAKNISAIHQNAPHLSPIRRDMSKLGYNEATTWKDWTGDEFVRQITQGVVRSPDGKNWVQVTDPVEREAQIRNGIAFAKGALQDPLVRSRLSPKLIADFEQVAKMTPPEPRGVEVVTDNRGRPTGEIRLPSAHRIATDTTAQQSVTAELMNTQNPQQRNVVINELVKQLADLNLPANHPDRAGLERYLTRLKTQAQASNSTEAIDGYNKVIDTWTRQLNDRAQQAERDAIAAGKTGPQVIQDRQQAEAAAQAEQRRMQTVGLTRI